MTPVKGDVVVGAEPRLGACEWTIPKSSFKSRPGYLPVTVGSECCAGGTSHRTDAGAHVQAIYQTERLGEERTN